MYYLQFLLYLIIIYYSFSMAVKGIRIFVFTCCSVFLALVGKPIDAAGAQCTALRKKLFFLLLQIMQTKLIFL